MPGKAEALASAPARARPRPASPCSDGLDRWPCTDGCRQMLCPL